MDDDRGYPYFRKPQYLSYRRNTMNYGYQPLSETPKLTHWPHGVRFVTSSFCGVLGGPWATWATWLVASWISNLLETMSWTNRDRGRPWVRIWIWLWNMDMIMQLCIQNDAIICFFTKRKCGKVLSHVQPIKLGNDPNWLLCWYGCLSVSSRQALWCWAFQLFPWVSIPNMASAVPTTATWSQSEVGLKLELSKL